MVVEGDFTAKSDVNHCIYNAKWSSIGCEYTIIIKLQIWPGKIIELLISYYRIYKDK